MGVDPGLTRCGLGVIEANSRRRLELVECSHITTGAEAPLDQRLLKLANEIGAWLDRYTPDAVAVERVFAQRNVMTITGTAQVAGIAIVEAARRGIDVATHTPTEVKAAVTGSGQAPKQQVAHMVTRLLGLTRPPRPADVTDALALAICHAWKPATLDAEGGRATDAQRAWIAASRAARQSHAATSR
jgi:crossover junction endodeoxyribonuclease RuvC